ncbi:NUDIX hydrolase [Hyphomonas sp.]|jgi:8-oxo-dGTP pyrophosphatase MutT (NUDIX family)|uniref:NUDIX hydrolase n=1 Tax=Hyphomonas sp. TaxID=87 RepID=UPI000C5E671A|nr:NUDIX hydrolase [Hyphomonas sp.]MAB10159.1 NUDIX hydrolase [Hyphomonas sp.]MAU66745.1 NUDIX hydrolase [Hyphomonas sp.]
MEKTPAEPRLSATILMVRDAASGPPEVLMVKRHYEIDFAAGALVFPGGKASEDDSRADWDAWTDGDYGPVQQDARIAAVREAYEESGLLLARHASARGPGAPLVGADIADKLAPHRHAVDRAEMSFLDLIREHELVLALDSLVHFGHWITPIMMPKRFDTHFYIAPAPEHQIAAHDGRETTDAVWMSAEEALAQEADGRATIIFPTRMNLKRMTMATSVSDALARFGAMDVPTVLPKPGKDDDGNPCLFIPDVEGYGQTVELLSNVKV